ncbi:hypothetical protein [Parafrankia discariae]|uniref:hypothetical protein n=1 Tax=Parafrankia discariae TaxID=365528 RepID=UPI000368CFFA|nr:hypothetical protein [Parafrankia discariae]
MRFLRNEITAGALADGIAPAVIFSEEVDAGDLWLIVGFEYIPGRPADGGFPERLPDGLTRPS